MNKTLLHREKYTNGTNVIYYVIYKRSDEKGLDKGLDEVLQHKITATSETAHVTLHPDGEVNFRIIRFKKYLEEAIKNNLKGYSPNISRNVRNFITRVSDKL